MLRPHRLAGLALALAACAALPRAELPAEPPRGAIRVDAAELGECARRRDPVDLELDDAPLSPDLELHLAQVPAEILRIAGAAGIRRLLAELLRARADTASAAPLVLQLQLVTRLSALEIEVASLLFEAQCVGNQMESTLRELEGLQRRREVALTVTSILVGAAAATAGGIWDLRGGDPRGPAALGIAGGAASASLGLAAFLPERRAVVFPHPRNLLAPIAAGEDPDRLYPAFVFRLLAAREVDGRPSPREAILEDWSRILADLPSARRSAAEAVLYGGGGLYDARLVDVRERMFDVLESHLNAIDHDLELLYRYTARLVEAEAAAAAAPRPGAP